MAAARWSSMTQLRFPLRSVRVLVTLLALPTPACLAPAVEGENGEAIVEPVCALGATKLCQQNKDPEHQGVSTCVESLADGNAAWGACEVNLERGQEDCTADETWTGYCCLNSTSCCAGEDCNTPLVLSFDGSPVRYSATEDAIATFDLSGHDLSQRFDWPTAVTPWLALDRDGNGSIDSGSELFGSAVRLTSGALAKNGFEALAEFDSNRDGHIDASDDVWARLVVWRDANGDRISTPSELSTLATSGVTSIDVRYSIAPTCDSRGNCEVERAGFAFIDGGVSKQGRVIDVHLQVR